jgi:hypothetical protein
MGFSDIWSHNPQVKVVFLFTALKQSQETFVVMHPVQSK